MKFNAGESVIHKDHPEQSWTVQKYTSETEVFCMRVGVIAEELKIIEAVFAESDLYGSEINTARSDFN